MKKIPNKYHSGTFNYELEPSDFNYLTDEFRVIKDSLGISLTSRTNKKLSIHIGDYGIKYDNDISERRMMIATERVEIRETLLISYHKESYEYMYLIPKTTLILINLINEFKYRGFGNVKKEEIIDFLIAESK